MRSCHGWLNKYLRKLPVSVPAVTVATSKFFKKRLGRVYRTVTVTVTPPSRTIPWPVNQHSPSPSPSDIQLYLPKPCTSGVCNGTNAEACKLLTSGHVQNIATTGHFFNTTSSCGHWQPRRLQLASSSSRISLWMPHRTVKQSVHPSFAARRVLTVLCIDNQTAALYIPLARTNSEYLRGI